jgi:hypothetical protein
MTTLLSIACCLDLLRIGSLTIFLLRDGITLSGTAAAALFCRRRQGCGGARGKHKAGLAERCLTLSLMEGIAWAMRNMAHLLFLGQCSCDGLNLGSRCVAFGYYGRN